MRCQSHLRLQHVDVKKFHIETPACWQCRYRSRHRGRLQRLRPSYWGWDPKETWALVTFFIYATPLHSSSLSCFRSHKVLLRYLLVAFMSVLMTYLGVNYLLSGLHSYGAA
ncbi:MAG: cytochrome c biogenesis protein CcsA [Duncaniella sp.]|nr:cytochrome c biogenesis protein CcsA [Duncaniella sp.]